MKSKVEQAIGKEARKKGFLSVQEQTYIQAHFQNDTPEAIASVLRRTPEIVKKYIQDTLGPLMQIPVDQEEHEMRLTLQAAFKQTPEWLALKKEFGPDEIQFFEHRYAKLLSQFKDDITPTEETQIFSLIKFEILMQRVLAHRQQSELDIKRMQKALRKLYDDCNNDLTKLTGDQRQFVDNMENNISSLRGFQHASNKEYTELQGEHSSILKALKGTRDQRITKIESNKMTFVDVIKGIMDDEVREKEARQMELMKLASAKELRRLGAPHKYADNKVDLPILNCETISG